MGGRRTGVVTVGRGRARQPRVRPIRSERFPAVAGPGARRPRRAVASFRGGVSERIGPARRRRWDDRRYPGPAVEIFRGGVSGGRVAAEGRPRGWFTAPANIRRPGRARDARRADRYASLEYRWRGRSGGAVARRRDPAPKLSTAPVDRQADARSGLDECRTAPWSDVRNRDTPCDSVEERRDSGPHPL